jgi:hypothetical protein
MASGIICQDCGIEAPTRKVCFYQNIGMLVMRTHRRVDGMLCKKCVNKHFWKMTLTTLFLGPWGVISLIVAPIFIINNLVRYLGVVGMPAVPADAKVPVLTEQAAAQMSPFVNEIGERLGKSEPLVDIANDLAPKAKVTPGQVVKYVVALSKQGPPKPPPPLPTGGFPVVMPPAAPPTVARPAVVAAPVAISVQPTPVAQSAQSAPPEIGI